MKTSQWRRAVENRCVVSARLKALSDRSGDRSAGGRRFYVHGWSVDCETSLSSCIPGACHVEPAEYQLMQIADADDLRWQ